MKRYRFRCFPNEDQIRLFEETFGCCRFVWNYFLAENKNQYEVFLQTKNKNDRPVVNFFALNNKLTELINNKDYPWLKNVSAVVLQSAIKNLSDSYNNAFKHNNGMPNFKSKHNRKQTFRFSSTRDIRLKGDKFYVPKSKDPLAIKWTRPLPGKPINFTITKTPEGKYWVSFLCETFEPTLTNGQGVLGIDLGLKDLVVDSDGNKYENPKFFCRSQKALAKAQRVLARRKKGSKRREKAKMRLARKHAKVANQRKDYLHKLTRKLVNENQVIGIEDLYVRGMVKNRRLAKSIMDSGLGMFKRFLEYKAEESAHTVIVKMNRWEPSTQTCNACGEKVSKKLTLSTREWTCEFCGTLHDRDVNASLNIKRVAKYMTDNYKTMGGTIVLAPPMLHVLKIIPRTAVNAQLISIQ